MTVYALLIFEKNVYGEKLVAVKHFKSFLCLLKEVSLTKK